MAKKILTDEALRNYLTMDFTQEEIARFAGVSQAAISKRIAALERNAVSKSVENAIQSFASLWDTREAAQQNYERCLNLLQECEGAGDKTRVLGEIRQHIQFGMQVLQTLYSIQEVQAFQEEVLTILDECEPGTRERILSRLQERRTLRAAFLPPAN